MDTISLPSTIDYGSGVPVDNAAEWIRAVRAAAGISQETFAERIGANRVTVANWERGKFAPDFPSVQTILRRFPVALELIGAVPEGATPAQPQTLEAREVAFLLDGLKTKDQRAYVRDLVYRVLSSSLPARAEAAKKNKPAR